MESSLAVLARTRYVLLTTFRRDGTAVPTAVWAVRAGDELLVWTNPTAGKVKRIRRDPRVEVGPCSRTGRPLGRSVPGRARILEDNELSGVKPALIGKYGWVARLTEVPNRLGALIGRPVPVGGLAITLVN